MARRIRELFSDAWFRVRILFPISAHDHHCPPANSGGFYTGNAHLITTPCPSPPPISAKQNVWTPDPRPSQKPAAWKRDLETIAQLRQENSVLRHEIFNLRFKALPQELQDMIYDFTISEPPGISLITKAYRPPAILQLHRILGIQLAKDYYGNGSVFQFPWPDISSKLFTNAAYKAHSRATDLRFTISWDNHDWSFHALAAWYLSLAPDHKKLVTCIRLEGRLPMPYEVRLCPDVEQMRRFMAWLVSYGNGKEVLQPGQLRRLGVGGTEDIGKCVLALRTPSQFGGRLEIQWYRPVVERLTEAELNAWW